MVMPYSGPISISQLNAEFGRGYSMGSYTQAGSNGEEVGLWGVNRCAMTSFYGRKLGGYEFTAGQAINFSAPNQTYIDGQATYIYASAGGGGGGNWYAGLLFPGGGGGAGGNYWPAGVNFGYLDFVQGSVGDGGAPAADGGHTIATLNGAPWLDFYPGQRGRSGYTENGYGGPGGTPNGNWGSDGVQAVGAEGGAGGVGAGGAGGLGSGGHGGGNGNAGLSAGVGGCFLIRWNNS